ncbi:MAG: transcription factor E [Thermoproteales archaeon]|nr:transcription factor E [Thermoproteales archaeon]
MIADEELLKQLAENIYGPVAGKIIELLIKKGEATDEEIAKYTDIGINDARRLLNFLFEANLVKYRRIRDEKIGWFTYFWRITDDPIDKVIHHRVIKVIEKLRKRLEYETSSTFYICPHCRRRYTFEEATENMFQCFECNKVLEPYDNSKIIEKLKKNYEKLKEAGENFLVPFKLTENME